jgi:hypothetical protein
MRLKSSFKREILMQANRRSFFAGALAACVVIKKTANAASEAATGTRRFDFYRSVTRIGRQSVAVSRSGSQVTIEVDVGIVVEMVGPARLPQHATGLRGLVDGKATKPDAVTDDNGSREFAAATRGPNGLAIKGSAYSGVIGGNPGTTTYWSPAFLKRPVWISTQDGQPLSVTARSGRIERFPTPSGAVDTTRWQIGGDLADLDLFYDRSGEWLGPEFQARGETVRMVTLDVDASLSPLWVDAA